LGFDAIRIVFRRIIFLLNFWKEIHFNTEGSKNSRRTQRLLAFINHFAALGVLCVASVLFVLELTTENFEFFTAENRRSRGFAEV
jgi:hypothetical protein